MHPGFSLCLTTVAKWVTRRRKPKSRRPVCTCKSRSWQHTELWCVWSTFLNTRARRSAVEDSEKGHPCCCVATRTKIEKPGEDSTQLEETVASKADRWTGRRDRSICTWVACRVDPNRWNIRIERQECHGITQHIALPWTSGRWPSLGLGSEAKSRNKTSPLVWRLALLCNSPMSACSRPPNYCVCANQTICVYV